MFTYREITGANLKEARLAIDRFAAGGPLRRPSRSLRMHSWYARVRARMSDNDLRRSALHSLPPAPLIHALCMIRCLSY
jgi:hypothetical protein